MIARRLLMAAAVAAGLWFAWVTWFPSDEAQIRAVLERLADGVAGGGGVEGLARLALVQEEFAVNARVDAGPPFTRLQGRQEIIATAGRVQTIIKELELRFSQIDITIGDDRDSATALVVAEARFLEPSGEPRVEARELDMRFTRERDRWVIAAVTLVEALERLDTR